MLLLTGFRAQADPDGVPAGRARPCGGLPVQGFLAASSTAVRARTGVTMSDNGRFCAGTAGVPVVTAPEELDITNAPHLELALAEAAAEGHRSFVVDMSRTRFCDSAGLQVVLAAYKRARAGGGGLVLAIGGNAVLRLFELTGAASVVPCFASLEEALARASGNGRQADGVGALQVGAALGPLGADAR
jgi:anti-sigma B factor antagonist